MGEGGKNSRALDYFRAQEVDSVIYAALFVFNLILGGYLILKTPVDLGGDTLEYIAIAKFLTGKGGGLFYYRSWGYPIFLIMTGYPWLGKPIIVQLIQLILGSVVPYLIGSSLRRLGVAPWICAAAAVAAFASLASIIFSAALLTDTYSEFLFYFTIWLLAWALAEAAKPMQGKTQWIFAVALGVAFFSLYLARPANLLLGIVGLGAGVALGPKVCRLLMLRSVAVLLLLIVAWLPLQRGWTALGELKSGQTFQTKGSVAGALFFWNIYSTGATFVDKPTIRPENGSCSSMVYESVQKNVETIGYQVYGRTITADEVFAEHSLLNHWIIWKSVEHDYGPERMDRVFWCAGFEGVYAEPKSLLYIYDGLVSFFFISDVIYNDGHRQAWPSIDYYRTVSATPLGGWALYFGTVVKVAAFLLALATLIPSLRQRYPVRPFVVVIWAMVLYLATIDVVFAAPHWRYTAPLIPALVLLAAVGLSALVDRHSKRAGHDLVGDSNTI